MEIFAIVSPPGRGKTTALLRVAEALAARGLAVGGVWQAPAGEPGARLGYDVVDVATGERFPLARRAEVAVPFVFDSAAFAWAAARIRAARLSADALLVDEIGRLEAAGGGHLPALLGPVPGERARAWVLAVRDLALPAVVAALGKPRLTVAAPLREAEVARVVEGAIRG